MGTGTKYQSGRDTAEIAKLLRQDIKRAQKEGKLPASLKVSIRTSRFSMGSAIDVTVQAAPVQIHTSDFVAHHVRTNGREFWGGQRQTKAARTLLETIKAMGEEYQRMDRDSQADYCNTNFYLHVKFDWALEQEDMAILAEYHAALPTAHLRLVG